MKIKKICFLAGEYPTPNNLKSAVFYQNLVHQYSKMGIDCRVIHPFPINYNKETYSRERVDKVDEINSVIVYRPKCITLGAKKIGQWNTAYATSCLYTHSAMRLLKQLDWTPDILFGHFISPAGVMAAKISKQTSIPAFIAYGESEPWSINSLGIKRTKNELAVINGFISVSTKNKKDLLDFKIANNIKISIFPNGVNNKHFYKRNKEIARKKMGWDQKKFIIAFVGHFNQRKGVLRLDEAIKTIPNVYVAYAGSGEFTPNSSKTIHNNDVPPIMMPWFLSAADIFVLPTLNEGSCNAIIEAMACGLPIISSDREFNYDILSNENAILINPESINDIKSAITQLINSKELLDSLSAKSLEVANNLNIERRASNILKWMESRC